MDKKLSYDSLSSLYANFGELYTSYREAYDSIQDVGSDRITGNDDRTENIEASNKAAVESLVSVVKEYQVHVDHARRRLAKMRADYEYYKNERDRVLREAKESGSSLKDLFKNAFGTAEINKFKRMDAEINFLEGFLADYDKLTDMVNSPNALDSMFSLEMDELMEKMSGDVAEVVANTVISRVKVEDLGDSKSVTISYDGFEFKPVIIPNDEFTMDKVEQIRNAVICKATLDKEKEMKVVLDVNGKEIETTLSQMGANLVEELAHEVTQEEVQEIETPEVEEVTEEMEAPEETVEVETEELTAEEKYANDGYGQNAFGEYFNPNIDEFDPEYNPNMDPLYATQTVETPVEEVVEEITEEVETPEETIEEEVPVVEEAPVAEEMENAEIVPPVVETEEELTAPVQQEGLYSEKTYQVMKARQAFKDGANKVMTTALIAGAGLFGLATAGLGTMPLAAVASVVAVGAAGAKVYEELRFKVRRACTKWKLKRLAKKVGCTLRCEDGKASFYSEELGRDITSNDIEELQASSLDEINVQEKLDKIFKNNHRGVANPTNGIQADYYGFQKVTVDNLEAAFEEFGGVKKEDEVGLWDKIMFGVENSLVEHDEEEPVVGEEVPAQEEQQMIEAEVLTQEEVEQELGNEAEEMEAPVETQEESAPVVEAETVEAPEEVQEAEMENGTSLEDDAVEFMMQNSSVAEQIVQEAPTVEAEALSPEEMQALLDAVDGNDLGSGPRM